MASEQGKTSDDTHIRKVIDDRAEAFAPGTQRGWSVTMRQASFNSPLRRR
jgi:hypothetical protein